MSYGKLNKDIYENRRRLGYVTEMFEFYDKFSDPYGSRGDVDSCDKWILRVKRDSGKGGLNPITMAASGTLGVPGVACYMVWPFMRAGKQHCR